MIWTVFNEEEKNIKEQLIKNNIKVDNISGSTQEERRGEIINRFRNKKFQVLISKPKILGFGINLEFCSIQIFSGITDSYEQFYQAIRRSYRYGATEQLKVFIPVTKAEKTILENVLKKKDTFDVDSLNQETNFVNNLKNDLKKFKGEIIMGETKLNEVQENYKEDENWKIYLADSIIKMEEFKNESIDFSIFSPPFASLFTYSEKLGDIGNSRDGNEEEFNLHMEFFLKRLFNVMKKNRNVCCHVQQLCTYKGLDGYVGTKDFRGLVIELFKKHGFIFFGEFVIKKNPQAQAIRNKVRSLSFSQMEQDRSGIRPGFNDYVLIFKKLGDNNDIINDETGPTRDEWINWAAGVWTDIKETDTLNTKKAKGEDDVKHVCPLQLEVIRRCIRMYTNKGDTVLDPFNGIGSSGVVALELQRKYIGIELKPEYFNESIKNFKKAKLLNIDSIKQESLRKKMKSDDVINSKSLFEF